MGAVGWVGKGTPTRWACGRSSPLGRLMETEPSAAVLSLLRRHGLHAHEPQLRALGATTPLHLLQLVLEDLRRLTALLPAMRQPDSYTGRPCARPE